jgi:hypothetical protein
MGPSVSRGPAAFLSCVRRERRMFYREAWLRLPSDPSETVSGTFKLFRIAPDQSHRRASA